jgi:hypothetical protein
MAAVEVSSERELYYRVVESIRAELVTPSGIGLGSYLAILYFKNYWLPPAVAKTAGKISNSASLQIKTKEKLLHLSGELCQLKNPSFEDIPLLLARVRGFSLHGMAAPTSLPTQSTFLHFLYPSLVPIFDKFTVGAVGEKYDPEDGIFPRYVQHVHKLATKYHCEFAKSMLETPIRAVEMALWINGHKLNLNHKRLASY